MATKLVELQIPKTHGVNTQVYLCRKNPPVSFKVHVTDTTRKEISDMKGRNSQVSRIYMILNLLEGAPHGLSVSELVDRLAERLFEVSKRTVYRDLDALRAAGFPLDEGQEDLDSGTRWILERNAKVGQYLVLSSRELISLYLARQALKPLSETPFFEDLNSTFIKIEEKIGSKAQAYLTEIASEIHFEPGPQWGLGVHPDVLDTLRIACSESHVLEVTYQSTSSQSSKRRRLGPHYLYLARGSLYLVAEDLDSAVVKVFSVPRMSAAQMSDQAYLGQKSDPEDFFCSAFGIFRGGTPVSIKLVFNQIQAPYIRERRWHKSQSLVNHADGTTELRLEAALSPELVQWVQGFGPDVTVTEPESLKELICERSAEVLQKYKDHKSSQPPRRVE